MDLVRQQFEAEAAADRQRAQAEMEALRQQLAVEALAERHGAQAEIAAVRRQVAAEATAERQRAEAERDVLRQRVETEITAARQAAAANPTTVATPAQGAGLPPAAFDRALAAMREIDGARTLSQALDSLLSHAGAVAGRAAVFLINGDRLKAWKASGLPDVDVQTVESSISGRDLLARAIQSGQATSSSAAVPAPPFARLPADRTGLAVPLMIAGRAVAVLYADSGASLPPAGSEPIIEALARHTAAVVALRTAMRTLDVLGGGDAAAAGSNGEVSDVQGARRYARLLVSEIKLYNEAAVRTGREERDLLQRLRPEIDRAQRLYEERVPAQVGGRHAYFHQELVQTLADGDPSLLGNT